MARFVSRDPLYITETDVLTAPPDDESVEWIAIKPKLAHGDRNRVMGAMLGVGDDKGRMEFYVDRALNLLLQVAIVDWHLHGEDGNDVPFSRQMVEELDSDDPLVDKVFAEVSRRNPIFPSRGRDTSGESDG